MNQPNTSKSPVPYVLIGGQRGKTGNFFGIAFSSGRATLTAAQHEAIGHVMTRDFAAVPVDSDAARADAKLTQASAPAPAPVVPPAKPTASSVPVVKPSATPPATTQEPAEEPGDEDEAVTPKAAVPAVKPVAPAPVPPAKVKQK